MPGQSRENAQGCPPFHVCPMVKGQRIDSEVRAALEQLWPWFRHYVDDELGDPERAGNLADELAYRLTIHVKSHRDEVRSLVGLCRVAAMNFVGSTKARERKIEFWGLGQDVEASAGASAPNWQEEVDMAILVDQILPDPDHEIRVMLQLRLLEETWDFIGDFLVLQR